MKELSQAARNVVRSPIRRMFDAADGLEDVVSFTVGEPDFRTPDYIVAAAVDALRRGEHHYTPNAGILPLRQAIADRLEATRGVRYDPRTEIIVTAGGMEALLLGMLVLAGPGDDVLLSSPYWTNYPSQIIMAGAAPNYVPVREADAYQLQADAVLSAVTPRSKALIVNSPSNPTGGVSGRGTLAELARAAREKDLWVISDEVYGMLLYDGASFASIVSEPEMKERTLLIDSFSKTYAMTGWRVGWAAGPAEVIGNMTKLQESVAGCVNSAAQYGAIAALTGTQEPLQAMLREYTRRRELLLAGLREIPGVRCAAPGGTFYAFINIAAAGLDSEAFAMELLREERLVVVPGSAFGADDCIRISYATSEANILEGLKRLKRYMLKRLG